MTSVDLFSGLGGFALAFADLFTPLLYCEKDPFASDTLRNLMRKGALPEAPVVGDVIDIAAIKTCVKDSRIDLLTAGFPCIGFSASGKQDGFANAQSSLFHAASDVIDHCKPALVLFENVAEILAVNDGEDFAAVLERMSELGYDCRWTVYTAHEAGSPQMRKRWFCLCVRRGAAPRFVVDDGPADAWTTAMPPLVSAKGDHFTGRFSLLGNAIVPPAARKAFVRLYTAFKGGSVYVRDAITAPSRRSMACALTAR
jgi:DNA-cytosine methyltransferase